MTVLEKYETLQKQMELSKIDEEKAEADCTPSHEVQLVTFNDDLQMDLSKIERVEEPPPPVKIMKSNPPVKKTRKIVLDSRIKPFVNSKLKRTLNTYD